jgi:hypothetical protein
MTSVVLCKLSWVCGESREGGSWQGHTGGALFDFIFLSGLSSCFCFGMVAGDG